MKFIQDDGGRTDAGFLGITGDCVTRAISIATEIPYGEVYAAMAEGNAGQRNSKHATKSSGKRTARNGIFTSRKWFKDYMASIGWKWTATMGIGTGCTVHLTDGELPMGRLIVSLSKHYTAVIDGVIHDIYSPERNIPTWDSERGHYISRRCVYGYWSKA